MDRRKIEKGVDELIDFWAKHMADDQFIAALEEMIDRAQVALDARREELNREGEE